MSGALLLGGGLLLGFVAGAVLMFYRLPPATWLLRRDGAER